MPTFCACGNELDAERPAGFRCTQRPCTCESPAAFVPPPIPTGERIIMRGDHPRDPKRAALGLPDRTPLEKAVLRGSFHE